MVAQFAWIFIFYMTEQYILILLCMVDFIIWGRGVHRNRPLKRGRKKK
jgi:hypothetical protein